MAVLMHPVEAVTPEMAAGSEIKVFLAAAPEDPARLTIDNAAIAALLVSETEKLVKEMSEKWPENLNEARDGYSGLEELSDKLQSLWEACEEFLKTGELAAFPPEMKDLSVIFQLFHAESLLARQLPQEALASAETVEEDAASQKASQLPWTYAAAKAAMLRGKAHLALNQSSLAEMAFSTTIEKLVPGFSQSRLLQEAFLERGAIREENGDGPGSCADYLGACGAGDCLKLSVARASGQCN